MVSCPNFGPHPNQHAPMQPDHALPFLSENPASVSIGDTSIALPLGGSVPDVTMPTSISALLQRSAFLIQLIVDHRQKDLPSVSQTSSFSFMPQHQMPTCVRPDRQRHWQTLKTEIPAKAPHRNPCDATSLSIPSVQPSLFCQPIEKMVPRDRIELPTRGFSVRCSTN